MEGLEAELPSSLPYGYPFYATDTRRLFVGRGEEGKPLAIFSNFDEELRARTLTLENAFEALGEELLIRLGQIGKRNVDESEIGDGKLIYYDGVNDVYKFIDPLHVIGGGPSSDTKDQQVTLKNVIATPTKPHKIYIDIPYTVNFNRRPLEILKFVESQDNIITIAATYDNQEASQFIDNKYILFDGAMKLQTRYQELMTVHSETTDTAIYTSIPVDFNEFKFIEELNVSTQNIGEIIHSMIQAGDTHYSFLDSEWVNTHLSEPDGIEFFTNGMKDLRVVTTPTTNARFTLEKTRDEDTGFIFETAIDVNLFKKINKIKVRQ